MLIVQLVMRGVTLLLSLCPLILQEIFLQAAHSGWKEAEWMICWGHQHGLLYLDPEADISAIQLVGYQTTREKIRDLYHQVYKLRRLLGSPSCGPEQVQELTRDVVSSLKNHLRWRGHKELEPINTHLSPDRTSQRMRWGTSAERELAEAREAHRWEHWIERLSRSTTRARPDTHIYSQNQDWWRRRSCGQSRRCHRGPPEENSQIQSL